MTPEQAQQVVEQAIVSAVPDADVGTLGPDDDLRETLELDSLDFVAVVESLSVRAAFRIDEEDYRELRTLARAAQFVAAHAPA
ncbi:MAG TPA: acyl carrier protein [Jatrophihabitans sp.]|jgi:acyl carrier protein|uniref:acyl carrier protein n=1 Tax=Jatrophihabitans sp. TaxID=1932789 RepID=UPI002DFCC650|nr:acyl carrier protein [Jatrophihabitans sp.]